MYYIEKVKIPMKRKLAFLRKLSILEWEECFIRTRDKTKSLTLKKELTLCCLLIRCAIDCNATNLAMRNDKNALCFSFEFRNEEDLEKFKKLYHEKVFTLDESTE